MAGTCVPALDRLDVENSIDSALRKARSGKSGTGGSGSTASIVADIEPWDEEVDAGVAVNQAIAILQRHVLVTPAQRLVTVLWALHTHLSDAFFHSPRINVFSPMKRCGKSTLRRIVAGFVARPVLGENISPAVIYHVADAHRPTFLFDEVHLMLSHRNHDRASLYSLMSAGYERTGATWRMQGEGSAMAAKPFRTYSPMLLAGIGRIGGSLGDRCIPVQLKRKMKSEAVELFDFDTDQAGLAEIARKFARWAADNIDTVRAVRLDRTSFQASWDDRQCDCARPLLKIASVLGEAWLEAVRNALEEVWKTATGADLEEEEDRSAELLADIKAIFEDSYPDRRRRQEALDASSKENVASKVLIDLLTGDPLKPWSMLGREQKPLTQNKLARMLRPYAVTPQNIDPTNRLRGYYWRQFRDAWGRYT